VAVITAEVWLLHLAAQVICSVRSLSHRTAVYMWDFCGGPQSQSKRGKYNTEVGMTLNC
jgi:hypothetical protein